MLSDYRLRMEESVMWGETDTVVSICSKKCDKGEERIVKNPNRHCCWQCNACSDDEYVPDEKGHCMSCPAGKNHLSTNLLIHLFFFLHYRCILLECTENPLILRKQYYSRQKKKEKIRM